MTVSIGESGDGSAMRNLVSGVLTFIAIASAPLPAGAAGDVLNGLKLSQLMCTRCHVVGWGVDGARKAPRLPQTVNRKALEPAALRAWLNESHAEMPNFGRELSQQQIEDIAAYLDTLRVR